MPSFGHSGAAFPEWQYTTENDFLAQPLTMPEDGWITELHVRCMGNSGVPGFRLALYEGSDRVFAGPNQNMGQSEAWRSTTLSRAVAGGTSLWIGVWSGTGGDGSMMIRRRDVSSNERRYDSNATSLPASVTGTAEKYRIQMYADYIAQAAPGTGAWQSPTPAEGNVLNTSTPTFKGSTPHNNGDGAHDQTNVVHLQAWNTEDPSEVFYDQQFNTNADEKAGDYFERSPVTIPAGKPVTARYRHQDTWGAWSGWSAARNFQISPGPDAPAMTRQSGKINWRNEAEWLAAGNTGPLYAGTYNNPSGAAMHSVRVELWNRDRTIRFADSGFVNRSATGGIWTLPQASFAGHPSASEWATGYSLRAKVRETAPGGGAGIESGWGPWRDLNTNAFPNAPQNLDPADGIATSSLDFSATVTDPDLDLITAAEIKLINAANNATVAGYPKAMNVSGTVLSFTAAPTDLVVGSEYRWQARARDATGWGGWSDFEVFTYATVPSVAVLAPAPPQRRNLVADPSAEYDLTNLGAWWTDSGTGAADFFERVSVDAASGDVAYRATTSATSALERQGPMMAVDGTKPHLLQAELKRLTGTTSTRLRLLCYDSSSALTGTLEPSSILAASGANVPTNWTRYGGIVWPIGSANSPALPAGTTQVKVSILPSQNSAATALVDSVAFEPVAVGAMTPAQWAQAQKWRGYFDGDEEGYGSEADGSYAWEADRGRSASLGYPVLSHTAPKVYAAYSSPSALNLNAYRLVVERYQRSGGTWELAHDTGMVLKNQASGTVVEMPVPVGALINESRFRFTVTFRDSNLVSGTAEPVVADVRYIGPAERNITLLTPNPEDAAITVSWEPTDLVGAAFGGYEVARRSAKESFTIIGSVTNPEVTSFVDRFPISGEDYTYHVRQLEVVGAERVEGRWTRATATCTYERWFLKAVDDPTLEVAVKVYSGDPVTVESSLPVVGSFKPLFSARRVHYAGAGRDRASQLTVRIHEDEEGRDEKVALMERITAERPTLCLLAHRPEEKRFVFPTRVSRLSAHVPEYVVYQLDVEDTLYSEDVYAREGRLFTGGGPRRTPAPSLAAPHMCRLADSPALGMSHHPGAGPRFPVVQAKVT